MVRTKKPSAKKQTHNKCRNAKGLRPYKWSELKNLRQKSKRTISAETPRGFDLTNGPNQKTFGKKANAQQVQKRQGASTLQMVRTKKPSAKKQTHNKCRNAKGLRPYKWSEPKNLRQKSKRTTSAETPRGFDLTNGPNQKTFGKKANAQQVRKRQGAS